MKISHALVVCWVVLLSGWAACAGPLLPSPAAQTVASAGTSDVDLAGPIDVSGDGELLLLFRPGLRGFELANTRTGQREIVSQTPCSGYFASISPDKKYVCFKDFVLVGGRRLQLPTLYDIANKSLLPLCKPAAAAGNPVVSAQGEIAFTVERQLIVLKPDLSQWKQTDLGTVVNVLAFSPDGRRLAFSEADERISWIETGTGERGAVPADRLHGYQAQFSPGGRALLARSSNGEISACHLSTGVSRKFGSAQSAGWIDEDTVALVQNTIADSVVRDTRLLKARLADGSTSTLLTTKGNAKLALNGSIGALVAGNGISLADMRTGARTESAVQPLVAAAAATNAAKDALPATKPLGVRKSSQSSVVLSGMPYIHQLYDTADDFPGGGSACNATAALMAIQYYGKLPADPITCSRGGTHISNYGFYISRRYSYGGYDFNIPSSSAWGSYLAGYYGGFGYFLQDDPGSSSLRSTRLSQWISYHGLSSWTDDSVSISKARAQIDAGYPVVVLNSLTTAGHYITCKGYVTDQNTLIFNDPYGDMNVSYPGWAGADAWYDWPGYNNGYVNLNTVHRYIYAQGSVGADNADYVSGSQSLPDGTAFSPGQAFSCSWTFNNNGTTTWIANGSSGYTLNYVSGDRMGMVNVPISANVSPGANITITANFTAPTAVGSYTCYVRMNNSSGSFFGDQVFVNINVVNPVPVITTQPASATKDPGQSATFTVAATGATGYQWQKNGANISGATSATLTLSNVQLSDAAFYRVVVSNAAGSVTSSAAQLVVTATATGVGTGGGLRGCYYDNQDFSALRVSRLDGPVNFDWATGSPEGSLGVDSFSARWTGQVQPRYSQTYTFYTTTDDGVRLWVNGVLLIDHWAGQSATEWSGSIALTAGQKYDLQMDYYENSGSASAQLRWSSASQLKELIPATQLYRPPPVVAAPGSQTVAENSPLNVPITLVSWDQVGTVTPIEGFESYGDGTPTDQIMFRKPGNSGSTSGFLDGSVTNYDVPTGTFPSGNSSTRALHAYWSFLTGTTNPWLRLSTYNSATNPNPTIDISQSLWFEIYSDKALQVAVNVRETNPTGAIGSNGGSSGTIEFVGVSGTAGTTPIPTRTVSAGAWTTLKFDLAQEPVAGFTGNGILESTTGKAVLEALALVPAGGMGVYNVYLDNFVQVQNAALTYSLEPGAPAGAAIDASTGVFTWTPVAGQGPATYNITVRVTDGGTPAASATTTFAVTVSAPPVITAQPQSQAVGAGSSVTFSVTATGTAPLSYQWRKNGGTISGATASSYTLANAQPSDAGSYSVVVANAVGTVTSSNAVLTVSAVENPPSITAQPQSLTRIQGASATFSVTATGTAPLYYQWYWNGSALAGATQSSYTDASVQPADAGSYVVVVTNHVGSATSDAAILTVLVPPAIVTQPQSRAVIEGTNVTFTVSASGTAPLSFQWRKGGTPISGATGTSYSLSNVQASDAGTYTVVVTNAAGSATSANAVLTVNVPPAITVQPESQAVAAGSSVTFSVTASGSPVLSYQWRFNGTNLTGATASSYTRSNVQSVDVGLYWVVVSNPWGSVTSLEAALTLTGAIAFQDDFETCDLSGWTATAGTNGLDGSNAQNHTPGGGCSALVNHSLDKMYHNFGVEVAGRMRATWWIYDGDQTRVYAEVRAHTGAGYAEGVLQQLLAAGKYSGVTLSGEVWDGTKYQGRVSYGSSVGWFNLNAVGAPSRSTGWHKFVIERLADGTTLNFYVDGILSRTMTGVTDGALDSMLIGSVAGGSTVGDGWIDDVLVEYLDAPIIVTQPVGQTVTTGGSATFSVSAGNTVLSYQWRLNGENIAGATTSSWTVANAEAGDAGSYAVVVANGVGSAVSVPAVLVVQGLPEIAITSAVLGEGTLTLTWNALAGRTYRVQYKNNVTDTVWTDLPDITAVAETASAVCELVDGQGPIPRRFFRIMAVH